MFQNAPYETKVSKSFVITNNSLPDAQPKQLSKLWNQISGTNYSHLPLLRRRAELEPNVSSDHRRQWVLIRQEF